MKAWFDLVCFYETFESDVLDQWRNYEVINNALEKGIISNDEYNDLRDDLLYLSSDNADFGKFWDKDFYEIPKRPKMEKICNVRLQHFNQEIGCNLQILQYYFDVKDYFGDTDSVNVEFSQADFEKVIEYIVENGFNDEFTAHCEYVTTSRDGYIAFKTMQDVEQNQEFKMRLACEFLNAKIFDDNSEYWHDLNELIYS